MSEKTFILEIVTPRRVLFKGEVTSFSVPGVKGSFQVLHDHAPLVSALQVGEAKIVLPDGRVQRIATGGGFVEVRENSVVMVAESAEPENEIDLDRARAAEARARKRLTEREPTIDVDRAKAALSRALNRLRIASRS